MHELRDEIHIISCTIPGCELLLALCYQRSLQDDGEDQERACMGRPAGDLKRVICELTRERQAAQQED